MTDAICTKADVVNYSGKRRYIDDPCPDGFEEYQTLCCHTCPVKDKCLYRCDVSKSFETCIYKDKVKTCASLSEKGTEQK